MMPFEVFLRSHLRNSSSIDIIGSVRGRVIVLVYALENDCILRAPVPVLLVSLCIDVELGQEVLDINLVLDGQKAILEVLSEVQLLVAVSLTWCISTSSAA